LELHFQVGLAVTVVHRLAEHLEIQALLVLEIQVEMVEEEELFQEVLLVLEVVEVTHLVMEGGMEVPTPSVSAALEGRAVEQAAGAVLG
jgi:hypothetical protein